MKKIGLIISSWLMLAACHAQHMKSATAVTQVFGDGQRTTAAIVEYDADIKNSLSANDFLVEGRTITKVYANNFPQQDSTGKDGKYVIIDLAATDANAATFVQQGFHSETKAAKVVVKQTGTIKTADGKEYTSSNTVITSNKQINLIVDDFKQLSFTDKATGNTITYNLFIPKNYNKTKSYPLVMFIHDAGVTSADTKTTLVQGLGAVVWTTPQEQVKHECFVLAPQFDKDNPADEKADALREAIVHLIQNIESTYSIDSNRLYATGQSMGCMTSIALNIKYPNLFAASFLIAGQWDASQVSPLVDDKLWIVVSQGDERAYPGMNAITDTLEKRGATISRAVWNGRATPREFSVDVNNMVSKGTNINYTVLQKGTVVSPGMRDDGGSNHICTWRIAYTIEGIRDWLFQQRKKG